MGGDFLYCIHCDCRWTVQDPIGLIRHEKRCGLQVECPHCCAPIGSPCRAPSDPQGLYTSTHSKRERLAREVRNDG